MPTRLARLDVELVRRGMARSRTHAGELIAEGRVEVRGVTATKAASGVSAEVPIRVRPADVGAEYASRGGRKLAGALEEFADLRVADRTCLDAGASTGGFTDVLLRSGAASVVAVDVGYGQLAWRLRTDERVRILDRTNVRTLKPDDIGGPVELTVVDLSFISLGLVLPALSACTSSTGDLVPMVKPQFEVGRERLGSGGVVRDPSLRAEAVRAVVADAERLGWGLMQVAASPLPGPAGNVEFFVWLRREPARIDAAAIDAVVMEAG